MQFLILAGGKGTRLRSVISDVPKPMAPIDDQPFLAHLLAYLKKQGATSFMLSVGYLHEVIENFFGNNFKGCPISYVVEEEPLGTGGAIKLALSRLEGSEPVFVLNGDTFVDVNYADFYNDYIAANVEIGVGVLQVTHISRYGVVKLNDSKDRILGFEDRSDADEAGFINAGVYLLKPGIFEHLNLPESFSFESEFLVPMAGQTQILPFQCTGTFLDIGTPEDYAKAPDTFSKFSE